MAQKMAPMKAPQGQVKKAFSQAFGNAFPSIPQEAIVIPAGKFGDYQCNNAMAVFKAHGKELGYKKPVEVAEAIKASLPQDDMFGEVTVAPQGFVTVKLSESWITDKVRTLLDNKIEYAAEKVQNVVVDFSSPNIAKEMHVGHLRSTIMGESVCRILEFCGHEVHRLNHVGDWGTQFGMLIEYMREEYPNFEEQTPDVSDLQAFYKAAKRRFDEDKDKSKEAAEEDEDDEEEEDDADAPDEKPSAPKAPGRCSGEEFRKKARLAVTSLQAGDEAYVRAWQKICDVSRIAFAKIYKRLDINCKERGESFYNDMIPPLVKELEAKGICVESKGAKCVFTPRVFPNLKPGDFPPLMAVKSDGGYGYDSTDLAAIHHRFVTMGADWIVYLTDLGQEQHFHMVFDAAEQAGWHRPRRPKEDESENVKFTRCDHMGFGVVQGADGKKFKTRSGDVVRLGELLDEAEERALVEIKKRVEGQVKEGKEVYLETEEEQNQAATTLGIAAVRYYDMKRNRTSNYNFSYDEMLDSKGNSALYLFYAYARIRGIQRSSEKDSGVDVETIPASELKITHQTERDLLLKLLQFPDMIEAILKDLNLHYLTDYLWEVSNLFSAFYRECKVQGSDKMRSRLLICEATRKVMHESFFLLGFSPLERI